MDPGSGAGATMGGTGTMALASPLSQSNPFGFCYRVGGILPLEPDPKRIT